MQTEAVAKGLIFKMRIDERDMERLDALVTHYSSPSATVVRMLIKEKYDEIKAAGSPYRDEGDMFAEACRKMNRAARQEGTIAMIPSRSSSGIEKRRGKTYFVLRNIDGELARFVVTPSGDLKALKD